VQITLGSHGITEEHTSLVAILLDEGEVGVLAGMDTQEDPLAVVMIARRPLRGRHLARASGRCPVRASAGHR
jgi:hypothetical protein